MLTEKQQLELNQIRHDVEVCKSEIVNRNNSLDNEIYAINCLDKWKKGRSVGFFICMIATVVSFAIEFFYVYIQANSMITMSSEVAGAIEFAVSSTALSFFTIVFLSVSIGTVMLGIRLMMEIGNSSFSRRMASKHCVKNYYNHVEDHVSNKIRIEKEIYELKMEKRELENRLAELEKDEIPWNFA